MITSPNLTALIRDEREKASARIVVVGEVLWDLVEGSTCLGGAPLNFAAHCRRLGHNPILLSAVGTDALGDRALDEIAAIGLNSKYVGKSNRWKTGTATVSVDEQGQPSFKIERPAAYDDVQISDSTVKSLVSFNPSWLYFGTLFASLPPAKDVLDKLLQALPHAKHFYDLNLRPGFDSPELVSALIARADVVKLNEAEAEGISAKFRLPSDLEAFCRSGAHQFGWSAVCVTLGAEGCALLRGTEFVRAEGFPVTVADTIGAGDAFAAALLHGLVNRWPTEGIAEFANRVGALVASRTGAIPNWEVAEVVG